MADAQLLEQTFTITTLLDQKYDRVVRVLGTSQDSQTQITLDINSDLYPVSSGENITMCLASTLNLDGTKDERGWRPTTGGAGKGPQTLADLWDYVCYGKIYRFEEGDDRQTIKCYVSFGGLLLCLDGPYKKLSPLRIDNVYMLLKR